jgi:chromate transporter
LFVAFLEVSLRSFGGGLVWVRRVAVDRRQQINEAEFGVILNLSQFMPGPNVVGIAVCVGAKLRGLIGAIAAVSGFVLIPWTIGLSLGVLYLQHVARNA